MASSQSANFFQNLNSQIRMLRKRSPQKPTTQDQTSSGGERGGTGHIMMEFNPEKNRLGFYHDDREIEVDEGHYAPMFIAKDVEELRANPQARKMLKEYQMFTGQNQEIKVEAGRKVVELVP